LERVIAAAAKLPRSARDWVVPTRCRSTSIPSRVRTARAWETPRLESPQRCAHAGSSSASRQRRRQVRSSPSMHEPHKSSVPTSRADGRTGSTLTRRVPLPAPPQWAQGREIVGRAIYRRPPSAWRSGLASGSSAGTRGTGFALTLAPGGDCDRVPFGCWAHSPVLVERQ
jgi:hypothetical protein